MPSRHEVKAALEVLESEIGTSNRQWLKSLTEDVLKAAERERAYDVLGEPKLCPSADE